MEECTNGHQLDRLAEVLYYAQDTDLRTLGQLYGWFRKINLRASRQIRSEMAVLSDAASNVVEKIIRRSMKQRSRACEVSGLSGLSFPADHSAEAFKSKEAIKTMLIDQVQISRSKTNSRTPSISRPINRKYAEIIGN